MVDCPNCYGRPIGQCPFCGTIGQPMTIQAIAVRTNAELMAECADLGYLPGTVLDMTYGLGAFWTRWKPRTLIAMDRYVEYVHVTADATCLPFGNGSVDTAVYDP